MKSSLPGTAATAARRFGVVLLAMLGLAACQREVVALPGYFDKCFGGKARYSSPDEPVSSRTPAVSINIALREQQWSALREAINGFSAREGLQIFDTSIDRPGVRMLELSACSERGVRIYTTQRLWDDPKPNGVPEDRTDMVLYCYEESSECSAMASRLESFVREQWPEVFAVKYR
jgi:hypothetical protein